MEIWSWTLFQLECYSAAVQLHRPKRAFANWCFVIRHKEAIKPICFYLSLNGRRRRWPCGRGEQIRCRRDPLCVNSSFDPENCLIYMIVLGKTLRSFLRAERRGKGAVTVFTYTWYTMSISDLRYGHRFDCLCGAWWTSITIKRIFLRLREKWQ